MTRQRLRESILKELAEPCFYCDGIGYLKSIDTISYEIIRDIKKRLTKPSLNKITVQASSVVIKSLLDSEKDNLKRLEEEFRIEMEYKPSEERTEKYKILTG